MKKLSLTFAMVLGLGMASYAEGGGLFGQGQSVDNSSSSPTTIMSGSRIGGTPAMPGHGHDTNQPAPLGSGIVVLVSLGAAYVVGKRRKE